MSDPLLDIPDRVMVRWYSRPSKHGGLLTIARFADGDVESFRGPFFATGEEARAICVKLGADRDE